MAEAEDSPSSPKRRKTEELAGPSRKYGGGGAIYKSRFQVSWQKKWPCVKPVKNDPHHFECTVCSEHVSCQSHGPDVMWELCLVTIGTNPWHVVICGI